MGLREILASFPRAIVEKARSDEFGPDYRQRWQKYQDEHVRGELQNAISTNELQTKTRAAAAEMRAAGIGKAPGTPPEQAMGENLAEDRSLGNRLKQANISYLEQKPDIAYAGIGSRQDIAKQAMDLKREIAGSTDEYRKAQLRMQLARLNQSDEHFDSLHGPDAALTGRDEGQFVPHMDPKTGVIDGVIYPRTKRFVSFADIRGISGAAPASPAPGAAPPAASTPPAPGGEFRRSPLPANTVEEVAGVDALLKDVNELDAIFSDPKLSKSIGESFGGPFGAKSRLTGLGVSSGLVSDPTTIRTQSLIARLAPQQAFDTGGKQLTKQEWALVEPYLPVKNTPIPLLKENMKLLRERLTSIRNARVGRSMGGAAGAPTVTVTVPPQLNGVVKPQGTVARGPDGSRYVSDGRGGWAVQ